MLLFTTNDGKSVKTDLTELAIPAFKKFGKENEPSFFPSLTLLNGSLYFGVNRTGNDKKFISMYIPQDCITIFRDKMNDFVKELATNSKASCNFTYKNKEGVPVSLEFYAVIGADDNSPSYLKSKWSQGSDSIEFNSQLTRRMNYYTSRGKNFFKSLSCMVDDMNAVMTVTSAPMLEHFLEMKKVKAATQNFKGKEEETYSNNTSSSYSSLD